MKTTSKTPTQMIRAIFRSAQQHGVDSEPDHEVGDLQEAFRLAWSYLSPAQQRAVCQNFLIEFGWKR